MPWNGSGSFTRSNGYNTGTTVWTADKNAAVKITAARHDTHDNDLRDGINACLTKNGENSPSANLPMGGYKHTSIADSTARNQYAATGQVQDGAFIWGGTATGSNGAYAITLSPAITAYAAGQRFQFLANHTYAGAATLAVNGLAAKNIRILDGSVALVGGEILSGYIVDVVYDGTQFVLQNHAGGWATWTPTYSAGGTMTYTSVTTNIGKYRRVGSAIEFILYASGTTGGSADGVIKFTLPVAPLSSNLCFTCNIYDPTFAGNASLGQAFLPSASTVFVWNADQSNWGLGAGRNIFVQGIYDV